MLLAAGYDLGTATEDYLREQKLLNFVDPARELLESFSDRLHFPVDVAVAAGADRLELKRKALPTQELIVDIGRRTVEAYRSRIASAGTVFVNGPAGVYENPVSAFGTRELWSAIAASPAFSVIGGGDSIAAARKFSVLDQFSYVCTAGGGLVRFLAGERLPVVDALREAAVRFTETPS